MFTALKYHPDRNPGREDEVNAKFQVIQAANEVLSDPQEKAKYDALLARSGGGPGASGVKGNPWANVSQQFPTPPRRTAGRSGTSGAQRWQSRFSSGVPPTAKQAYSSDPEAKKNAAKAFDNMRKGSQRESRPSQQPPPPPPRAPPRTESARQRAEASFGARKSGYYPRAAMGDEPQVSSQNYSSRPMGNTSTAPQPPPRKAVPVQTGMPDPLMQFRDKASRSSASADKHRSSSVPRPAQDSNDPNLDVPGNNDGHPYSANDGSGYHSKNSFKSRADGRSTTSSDSDQRKEGASAGAKCELQPVNDLFSTRSRLTGTNSSK